MSNSPPPEIQAAAAKVQSWLDSQPPLKATDEQFKAMSPAQRLDYTRRFPQTLDSGLRK